MSDVNMNYSEDGAIVGKKTRGVKNYKQRLKLVGIFSLLLVFMSVLCTWLIFSSFKSNYKDIKAQTYALVTDQVVASVESALKYGKDLHHFYGIDNTLTEMSSNIPDKMDSYVVDANASVLYQNSEDNVLSSEIAGSITVKQMLSGDFKSETVTREFDNGDTAYLRAIYMTDGSIAGGLIQVQDKTVFSDIFSAQLWALIKIALCVVVSCIILMFVIMLVLPEKRKGTGLKTLIYVCAALVIISVAIQGFLGYSNLQDEYKSTMSECGTSIANYIGTQIEKVHDKGIEYEDMATLSEFLSVRIEKTSLMWNMQLIKMVANTDDLLLRENEDIIYIPITTELKNNYAICFQLSSQYMNSMLMMLFLTFLITIIVMLVMLGEVSRFPKLWIMQNTGVSAPTSGRGTQLRLLTFILFTANYISLPYSAVRIREVGIPLFSLSLSTTASLPLIIEIAATLVGMLLFQRLLKSLKNSVVSYFGLGCIALGSLASFFAASPATLILSRMLCGFGVAAIKLFSNRVLSLEQTSTLQVSLTQVNIGLLGGIMCGGSLGAVVADTLGSSMTFLCTLGVILLTAVLLTFILPGVYSYKDSESHERSSFFKMLANGKTLLYFVSVIIPLNVGIMFIVYFVPAFVQKIGQSALITSYSYIINGVAGIYLGSMLVKLASSHWKNKYSLIAMLAVALLSMLVMTSPSYIVVAVLVASALLGVFDTFGNPIASKGFLELPAAKKLSTTSALTNLSVLGLLVQTVSPLLYNVLISGMETSGAFSALWPVMLVLAADMAIVLIAIGRKKRTAV